jgi:hypothetical protein
MSDRLDRIERIVESNSRAIEALTNESTENARRFTSIAEQLTQVITMLAARQQDHENRINRLEE